MKKKIGIVVDNHKITKFKEELSRNGFEVSDTTPLMENTTTLVVYCDEIEVSKLKEVLKGLEKFFHAQKN